MLVLKSQSPLRPQQDWLSLAAMVQAFVQVSETSQFATLAN